MLYFSNSYPISYKINRKLKRRREAILWPFPMKLKRQKNDAKDILDKNLKNTTSQRNS
jgi:hypothetical protein